MPTATIITQYKNSAGAVTVTSEEVTTDMEINIDIPLDVEDTNIEVDVVFTVAKLKAIGLSAKKNAGQSAALDFAVTAKTNSSGSPDDTFTLTPVNGRSWSQGSAEANPVTEDVTKFYLTNTGDAAGVLSIRLAIDATP